MPGKKGKAKKAKSKPRAKKAGKSVNVTQKVVIAGETGCGGGSGVGGAGGGGFQNTYAPPPPYIYAHATDLVFRTGLPNGAGRAGGVQRARRGGRGKDTERSQGEHRYVWGWVTTSGITWGRKIALAWRWTNHDMPSETYPRGEGLSLLNFLLLR